MYYDIKHDAPVLSRPDFARAASTWTIGLAHGWDVHLQNG